MNILSNKGFPKNLSVKTFLVNLFKNNFSSTFSSSSVWFSSQNILGSEQIFDHQIFWHRILFQAPFNFCKIIHENKFFYKASKAKNIRISGIGAFFIIYCMVHWDVLGWSVDAYICSVWVRIRRRNITRKSFGRFDLHPCLLHTVI